MSASRKRLSWGAALAVVASGLLFVPTAPAQASVSAKISTFPYGQAWSDNGLITANDDWSGVTGVEGYLGAGLTAATGTDPQTITADGNLSTVDVIANNAAALNTLNSGGVVESELNQAIALQGSGSANAPHLVFHLDLTGVSAPSFSFTAKDLDGSGDNAAQAIATQVRIGGTGAYTNLPGGYVADATDASTATKTTNVSVTLPAEAAGSNDVYVRVMTTNAVGNDEWVGIDDIAVAGGEEPEPSPVEATSPGNKTGTVGVLIPEFTLAATGGEEPYSWSVSGLPDGVEYTAQGLVSGAPTEVGTFPVTATVSDDTAATDSVEFTVTVSAAPTDIKEISEVQGTGATSPYDTDTVTVEGVVTAMYRTGGFNGMYIQDPGADTDGASDAIFVWGNSSMPAGVSIGDSVRATGAISEFGGTTAAPGTLTELTPTNAGSVGELGTSLGTVTPREIAYPATEQDREAREGELLDLTSEFTVTNSYTTNQYAEVGLAATLDEGSEDEISGPLKQWTEYANPTDTAAIQTLKDENAARALTLDDGASVNYLSGASRNLPVPYLTEGNAANPVRVGAIATLQAPVILEWRNSLWKAQPTTQITNNGSSVVTFEDTRAANMEPQIVGGDVKIATFNVLNYFNTTGEAYSAAGPAQNPPLDTFCTYYTDRASPGNRIGNNSCGVRLLDDPNTPADESNTNNGSGPRGAATAASLARQEEKLVHTINLLGADVIGLEEIENSIKLPGETNRDDAVARLVELLNAEAGAGTWKYVKSPGEALTSGNVAEQDVIRPAFIYKPDAVRPVGGSDILFGTTQFANAREPLAQAFKATGAPDSDAFAVIVNHFKSKGDNASPAPPASGDNANDAATGVGAFNGDRTRQAERLVQFADEFAADRGIEAVFLAGDFNSYTKEAPIKVLTDNDFELVESNQATDESYSYQGLSGSLDHVLGNAAAMEMVTGADIWEINANESPAFQYSRFNYNVTDFWQPQQPFATSDHNPEIVGLDLPTVEPSTYKEIQVLGTNDFHGRLLPDAGNAAGAAPFATAVKELKDENPNSVFVAAGDLVGASTFESFIQDDEPTIDALNAMGLEVSAAGNHEFDRGYADLEGRIQDRANWEYLAANLEYDESIPAEGQLAQTWTKTIDGVEVGFVGAVTEDLRALVNPAGIEGISVTDVVEATNTAAADLKAGGADLVVLLVHEGSPSTECTSTNFTDPSTVWGNIVQNASPDVDAIISGHTHLAYNCRFPVVGWEGRAVTKRPVVSAGQYGTNLNQLVFKYDDTDQLVGITQDVVATAGVGYGADPVVQDIVDDAVDFAATAGAEVLGEMDGPFQRATYLASGNTTENRGGESTLSNEVAEVQRWATDEAGIDTDLAFMNPGGLRADMLGTPNGENRNLTYRQAADVQPFANTLVNMTLTGAQIEKVLEEQWQRNAQGGVPSRPFLRLGVSKGFTYTYVETAETVSVPNSAPVNTFKGEVTGMWLDGEPISPTATYSVTVNSFLGSGGDNFWELANGTGKVDSGKVDLEAMVDYMDQYDAASPLAVDYSQRAVEVTFPNDAPGAYAPGDTVSFSVASWAMSGADDVKDTELQVKLGDQVLGTAPVSVTPSTTAYDNVGTASVSVPLPAGVEEGTVELTLVGPATGTSVPVEVTVDDGVTDVQILATNDFHGRLGNNTSNGEAGAAVLAGAVKQLRGANPDTVFAAAGDLIGASTFDSFILQDKPTIDALNEAGLEVSAVGNHELDKGYTDLVDRVMAAESAENPRGGADWEYIAANLTEPEDADDIASSWTREFGDVEVGFVGAVTEDLMTLIQAEGNEGVGVTDIVTAVNAEAAALKTAGADVVVMLVHEGAPSTSCEAQDVEGSVWGDIVTGVGADVDAIVSGHTHFGYNCEFAVPAWADDPTRIVKKRPVVSAGQYGTALNQLVFTVDEATGQVLAKSQALLNLKTGQTANYPVDTATKAIVDQAAADAAGPGNVELGAIGDPFLRAKFADGNTENRGGESTLNNLVAEVQRWATPESVGGADIAFMNSGGLRDDMFGVGTGEFPRQLTYRQAANVQSFANTLVNMDLTGEQIKTLLEQQWQRAIAVDGTVSVPARSFIKLGVSNGFTYTYDQTTDPAFPTQKKGTVTGMWLDGEPIDLAATYSVTVNSFLSTGGDNFHVLKEGAAKQDTGQVDLESMVDYMAAEGGGDGQSVDADYRQRAVGVHFPTGAPGAYEPGDQVAFDLYSLSMSGSLNAQTLKDPTDDEVQVKLGDTVLGTFPVTTTLTSSGSSSTGLNDDAGTASVTVTLPAGTPAGLAELTVVGQDTGTVVRVPLTVGVESAVSVGDDKTITWGQATSIPVSVTGNDGVATGTVKLYEGATQIGSAVDLIDGAAALPVAAMSLEPGPHTLRVEYSGNYPDASDTVVLTVDKATPAVTAGDVTGTYGQPVQVTVNVGATATGTVEVRNGATVLGSAAVSGGVATVTVPAGSLEPGATALTAAYLGDSHFVAGTDALTATIAKATPTVSADNVSVVYGKAATVTVTVSPNATGAVEVRNGATVLGSATVSGGVAKVILPARSLEPGSTTLTAAYAGDGHFASGSDTFTVSVAKAASTSKVTASPSKAKVKKTRVTLRISVSGPSGVVATGKVKVKVPGQGTKTVTLRGGKATLKLAKFTSTGKKVIRIDYPGSDFLKSSSDTVVVKVVKK